MSKITKFKLRPGEKINNKYEIVYKMGDGLEGEVYKVKEKKTGLVKAAKIFYPHRNKRNKALRFTARKLHKLRKCSIVTQYHSEETIELQNKQVSMMTSELVEGMMLSKYVKLRRGKIPLQEAIDIIYALSKGVAQIHDMKEYHGDIHTDNIMVQRKGVGFEIKLIDFYNYGKPTSELRFADVLEIINVLYEILGGKEQYWKQPDEIKGIICGLKHNLIRKKYKDAVQLTKYLKNFEWH